MLVLFHDYVSPASALAVARLQRLADEGSRVRFEGFDTFSVGVELPVPVDLLAELDRLAPVAAGEGVTLRRPPALPPTTQAHAVGDHAEASGLGASWRTVAYRAFWEDGADLGDPAVLVDLGRRAGLDPVEVLAVVGDRDAVLTVRRRGAARRREGVGATPVLLAHGTLVPGLLSEADLRCLV